ncbi:unnamed protein product [Ectocarpus sp. 13 AM-2016]
MRLTAAGFVCFLNIFDLFRDGNEHFCFFRHLSGNNTGCLAFHGRCKAWHDGTQPDTCHTFCLPGLIDNIDFSMAIPRTCSSPVLNAVGFWCCDYIPVSCRTHPTWYV